jgi:hypothetical protein
MNLTLVTDSAQLYGVFGRYLDPSGNQVCVTLEHAYLINGVWTPKLKRGLTYTCQRGVWTLDSGMVVKTFQVMDVPNFNGAPVTDLLAAHPGNFNSSSKGCICTGISVNPGIKMILDSDVAFKHFQDIQADVDSFQLTIK